MPFCPMCGSEYEAGIERCADCNEPLVEHLPPDEQDTGQEMPDRLVRVAVFRNAVEAHLCKTRLESEGIECFLAGEYLSYFRHLSGESRGIEVQVRESDADRATEILRREPIENGSAEDAGIKEVYGPCCPRCGSPDIICEKQSPALIFMSLPLLGIPLLFVRKRWNCHACGHTWKAL